jgi:hypothetical protein
MYIYIYLYKTDQKNNIAEQMDNMKFVTGVTPRGVMEI